ncbi:aspartyl-phosphate phosphatase Spo0E family protein [Peribacillus glennii]|uniref:Aspartyl-phosphate phosphatase Spo0E family protein n=1 Tax=Peribacillus glennii TaxID=2303991 RepID=A0A372LKE5_9BACI|nr:aspartyl-phosphate phosphatase Spo0E family protein [Peribacillus glennii]
MIVDEPKGIEIEQKREEMINLAHAFGYSNPDTVKASQELDKLMNTFLLEKRTYSSIC